MGAAGPLALGQLHREHGQKRQRRESQEREGRGSAQPADADPGQDHQRGQDAGEERVGEAPLAPQHPGGPDQHETQKSAETDQRQLRPQQVVGLLQLRRDGRRQTGIQRGDGERDHEHDRQPDQHRPSRTAAQRTGMGRERKAEARKRLCLHPAEPDADDPLVSGKLRDLHPGQRQTDDCRHGPKEAEEIEDHEAQARHAGGLHARSD